VTCDFHRTFIRSSSTVSTAPVADRDGKGRVFHPATAPSREDIEQLVERTSKRILRFLERRGVITLVTAPGDGEVTVVADDTMGEKDPLLAKLLAAATAGVDPPGPANQRQPIRIALDPDERLVGKAALCGQTHGALRLISLIKSESIAKKILVAMHLPAEAPELHPARPPPRQPESGEDWVN